jgi:DNA-binding transcriptional LysR family regulator
MKELEEDLGVRLLDRNTARVIVTAAGAIYLQEAREILDRTERAGLLAREAARGRRGLLTIGEPGALSLPFLTSALTVFREQFPQVEVVLKEFPPIEQIAALSRGEIQVGFAFDHHLQATSALESFTVLPLRLGVAVGRTHPLAKQTTIRLSHLAGERLLCVGEARRSDHAATLRKVFSASGVKPASISGVATLGSLMTMIASGHGISILPHELTHSRSNQITIVALEGDPKELDYELKAIWRRDDDSALVKNFVRTLRGFSKRAAA